MFALGCGYANRHFKFVTYKDFDGKDDESFISLLVLAVIIWPITLFILIIAAIVMGFIKVFIPKE